MQYLVDSLLGLLAIANLTRILSYDKIMQPVREYFGIAHDDEGYKVTMFENESAVKNFIGQALFCFRCTSVWAGFFVAGLALFTPRLYRFFTLANAGSYFASLTDS